MESSEGTTSFKESAGGGVWTGEVMGSLATPDPGVLALHGFTGAGADFLPLWEACEKPIGLLAPDLPGHQGTSLSVCQSLEMMESCVEGLKRLTGDHLPGAHVVMGYSMGGRVAVNYALGDPAGLIGVVLVGTTAGIIDSRERSERKREDEALGEWILENGVEAFCERWMKVPIIATQKRIPAGALSQMLHRKRTLTANGLRESLLGMGAGVAKPLWDRLDEIKVPVLVVAGEEDRKYCGLAEKILALVPQGTKLIVPEAGHAAHLENIPFFVSGLERFMSGLV